MYRYVGDITNLYHNIIQNYCLDFNIAVDATLGNGYDADFLSAIFKKVYCFDIQKEAVEIYRGKNKGNCILINDSHANIDIHINENIDCITYNLGFLPGGNKHITTHADSTIESLNRVLPLLNKGGIICLAIYNGHEAGKVEKHAVFDFAELLPKNEYGVMYHSYVNRSKEAPSLIIIEKNFK